jgi:uncharacterized protein
VSGASARQTVEAVMDTLHLPIEGVGTEALDAFLSSDKAPPDAMELTELDGFLTGLAIGPKLVMPSEWLPIVWGEEEPTFDNEQEMQAVVSGIFSRYNEIIRAIDDATFDPILWIDTDGTAIAAGWAEGFALAIGLRPNAWDPLFKSRRHALLLFPILALCRDENGESVLGLDPETDAAIMAEAPQAIASCVTGIAAFWRRRGAGGKGDLHTQSIRGAVRLAAKPGRNETCPCGSGRKFKKCCGRFL